MAGCMPMVIKFKGVRYPKSVILHAVFFRLRYAVSHRDLEEILTELGVEVDRAPLNRRVVKFAPLIEAQAQVRKRPTAKSWRMDETCIKGKGKWTCLYRAVDCDGQTLDFMLSDRHRPDRLPAGCSTRSMIMPPEGQTLLKMKFATEPGQAIR